MSCQSVDLSMIDRASKGIWAMGKNGNHPLGWTRARRSDPRSDLETLTMTCCTAMAMTNGMQTTYLAGDRTRVTMTSGRGLNSGKGGGKVTLVPWPMSVSV